MPVFSLSEPLQGIKDYWSEILENKQVESNQSFYPAESMFFLWQNKNPLILQGVFTATGRTRTGDPRITNENITTNA